MEADTSNKLPQEGTSCTGESLPIAVSFSNDQATALGCPSYSGEGKVPPALQTKIKSKKKKLSGAQKRKMALFKRNTEDSYAKITPKSKKKYAINRLKRAKLQPQVWRPLAAVKMAIITDNFPNVVITQKMVYEIQGIFIKMLHDAPDPLPLIDMSNVLEGAVHVTCDGRAAADFLKKLDGIVVKGITIRVIEAADFPKPVKMAWKMKHDGPNDTAKSLARLQLLHPQLQTDEWHVMDTCVDGNQVRRIVVMDRSSADVIKAANYELRDGIGISFFKILDGSRKKLASNTVPMDMEVASEISTTTQLVAEGSQADRVINDQSSVEKEDDTPIELETLIISNTESQPKS